MATLEEQFTQAQQDVTALRSRPDNDSLLKLYALYKQATKGDVTGERPGGFDFVGRAKFDAWEALKGTSMADAMRQYVEVVKGLRG